MQSKLSKIQKHLLRALYFEDEDRVNTLTSLKKNDISSYNVVNHARSTLIKRGLLKKLNEGSFVKKVGLTKEGFETVKDLLLGDKIGFIIDKPFFDIILKESIENKEPFVQFTITDEKLEIDMINYLGESVKHGDDQLFDKIQGNGSIIIENKKLKIIRKVLNNHKDENRLIVSIDRDSSRLIINGNNATQKFSGILPRRFYSTIYQSNK